MPVCFAGRRRVRSRDLHALSQAVAGYATYALTEPGLDDKTALFVSVKTVRNNVSSIFTKLAVNSRAEAVARARDAGIGSG